MDYLYRLWPTARRWSTLVWLAMLLRMRRRTRAGLWWVLLLCRTYWTSVPLPGGEERKGKEGQGRGKSIGKGWEGAGWSLILWHWKAYSVFGPLWYTWRPVQATVPCLQEQNINCLCFRIGNESQVEEEEDEEAEEKKEEDEGQVWKKRTQPVDLTIWFDHIRFKEYFSSYVKFLIKIS